MSPAHLLFVEDDPDLSDLIAGFLRQNGFTVTTLERGDTAVETVRQLSPDLVLLDIMLPGKDGLSICRELRTFYTAPIVMLTSLDSDMNQVLGLELGANDYILKTTPPHVLLARIRVQLRAHIAAPIAEPAGNVLFFGQLRIDAGNREVWLRGERLSFSSTDFDLIWLLASHAGEILSRDDISRALRGIDYDGVQRGIDVAISRVRKKLGDDPSEPYLIKTVRNRGYLFARSGWGE